MLGACRQELITWAFWICLTITLSALTGCFVYLREPIAEACQALNQQLSTLGQPRHVEMETRNLMNESNQPNQVNQANQ